jgi:putative transposase
MKKLAVTEGAVTTMNATKVEAQGEGAARKKNRYRVGRGEPGCHVVTPIRDGDPAIENPLVALASPSSASLPAVIPENEAKPVVPSRYDRIANFRFTLVNTINREAAKESRSRGETIDKLLALYNGGHFLPGVLEEIGPISKRTFCRFNQALNDKGIDDLAPKYKQDAFSNISLAEKQFLDRFLHEGNKPTISDAIRECKKNLGERSAASPATLRRYVKKFFIGLFNDRWVLARKGEKAWMDEIAPYQDRDPMLLKFGQALVADGHKVNFKVIDPISGKPKRADLILFWDWKSTFPVGWEISFSECVQSVVAALFNALLTIGKLPDDILVDNGKAFLAKIFTRKIVIGETEIPGMIERLNKIDPDGLHRIKLRHAPPYHPQSKPIERFFRILDERFERRFASYVGRSVKDKPPYLLPNEPRAKALHDDWVPKVSEVDDIMRQWVVEYIDEPRPKRQGLTPRQMFEEGRGPGLDPRQILFLMMVAEVKSVRRCRFRFAGVDWEGPCLYGFNDKILIRYSLGDFSKIYVFDSRDRFMGVVTQCGKADPIKDWQAAKRISARRRAHKRETTGLLDWAHKNNFVIDGRQPIDPSEYIEIEEAKKPQNKIRSPWPDEPEPSAETAGNLDTKPKSESGPPSFKYDFEMYHWLMEQDAITQYQRDWIAGYRSSSSLLKHQTFDDEEELDGKVIRWREINAGPDSTRGCMEVE